MHVGAGIDDANSDCDPPIYGMLVKDFKKPPTWAGASGVHFCGVSRRESPGVILLVVS
jgi:hypothetical protein